MTDRELLELAAKAAGIEIRPVRFRPDEFNMRFSDNIWVHWNPLTDDGDAMRLAVKLKMRIGIDSLQEGFVIVMSSDKLTPDIHEKINNDTYAATRRAIVRAAAGIAEKKQ